MDQTAPPYLNLEWQTGTHEKGALNGCEMQQYRMEDSRGRHRQQHDIRPPSKEDTD
jgi:hypothetical protein